MKVRSWALLLFAFLVLAAIGAWQFLRDIRLYPCDGCGNEPVARANGWWGIVALGAAAAAMIAFVVIVVKSYRSDAA